MCLSGPGSENNNRSGSVLNYCENNHPPLYQLTLQQQKNNHTFVKLSDLYDSSLLAMSFSYGIGTSRDKEKLGQFSKMHYLKITRIQSRN